MQQVKIMFTPEAAHKINAACKGSSVTPLDAENQRVFNDVDKHGVNGEYYSVLLANGTGFSYPNRNIERVRSATVSDLKSVLDQEEAIIFAALDQLFSDIFKPVNEPTTDADIVAAGLYNESLEIESELELENKIQSISKKLDQEIEDIEEKMLSDIAAAHAEHDEDIARLYRK